MIIEEARKNGFYKNMYDLITYRLEKDDNGVWCLLISHYSGRDFYTYKPLRYLSDDELEELQESIFEELEKDIDDEEFRSLFSSLDMEKAVEELDQARYDCSDFWEALREYLNTQVFEMIIDSLIAES